MPTEPDEMTESIDLLGAIPEPYRSRFENAFALRWNQISAFSYQSFLEQRRGLVLLSFSGCTLEFEYLRWKHLKQNWDYLMVGSDELIKSLIRKYVPTYEPDREIVALVTYNAEGDVLVMKVTRSVLSMLSQPANSVLPTLKRYEYLLPKEAYQQLLER